MTEQPRKRIRLLGVTVQPRIVADDGTELEEIPVQPIHVAPGDWPCYATTKFAEAIESLEQQINAPAGESDVPQA